MIDPDQLQRTIADLQEREAGRPKPMAAPSPKGTPVPGPWPDGIDPLLRMRLAQERLKTERVFASLAGHNQSAGAGSWDLLDAGLSSILGVLGSGDVS